MAAAAVISSSATILSLSLPRRSTTHPFFSSPSSLPFLPHSTTTFTSINLSRPRCSLNPSFIPSQNILHKNDGSNNNNNGGVNNNNGGSGGEGGGGDGDGEDEEDKKNDEVLFLAEMGKGLENLPNDLSAGVVSGKITKKIVLKYFELEKSSVFKWLLQFAGFRERLLADDLFLAKLGMECGVGMVMKTLAEYNQRKENFFNEIEVVCADVVMAVLADFMLVYLPAPTVSLRSPIALNAGPIAKFLSRCPDNAFQIALGGSSYSLLERMGAIVRNGAKLFVVGTASSLVGTAVTNVFINARKAVEKSTDGEIETVPVLETSVGYGVYMAVSSNLRYQILAGVIEQRLLEPMFHQHKLLLSALCFAVRTGNTYLGSLLWVDYARWVGFQKAH